MTQTTQTRRPGRFRRLLGVWANPLVAPIRQIRQSVHSIRDMAAVASGENRKPRTETFDDAMARRPHDAMPLSELEKVFRRYKNVSTFFLVASLMSGISNALIFRSALGVVMSMALAVLAFVFSFRFNLRLWQVRHRRLSSMSDYRKENPDWIKGCFKFD